MLHVHYESSLTVVQKWTSLEHPCNSIWAREGDETRRGGEGAAYTTQIRLPENQAVVQEVSLAISKSSYQI